MARSVSFMIVVSSLALLPAGCSRTSDGTIVADSPIDIPSFNIPSIRPLTPSWMMREEPVPEPVAANFPPPPEVERPAPRRKARPPVVRSSSGNLKCENKTDGGRVRMVCQ